MSMTQAVIEKLEMLPLEKQQEVLDFVEFLQARLLRSEQPLVKVSGVSALEAAGDLVGCVKGRPQDLSTNKQYMEGFGES